MYIEMKSSGLGNVLPNIKITLSRYELADLVKDGKIHKTSTWVGSSTEEGAYGLSREINYTQSIKIEVKN